MWELAVAHEQVLVASPDPWNILREMSAKACANRMRYWRREVRLLSDQRESLQLRPSLADEDMVETVQELLTRLPDQQRLAIDLHYRWNLPYKLVAEAIETSEPTARVHVMKGLSKLCAWYKTRHIETDNAPK